MEEIAYMFEEYMDSGAILVDVITNSIGSLFGIAMFVLTAIGLYSLAKRRGIRNAWMAWIPVLNCWILGCISDQYRYVVKGQVKSKRKVLLVLNIVSCVLALVMVVLVVMMVFNAISGSANGISESHMTQSVLVAAGGILLMCLPLSVIGIVYAVFYYMALYDLYTSCIPSNNVLFLVLSILFNITEPFFIFFSRDKDQGMPPRRTPASEYIPEPPHAETYRNWNEPEQL